MVREIDHDFNQLSFKVRSAISALYAFDKKHGKSLSTLVGGIAEDLDDAMASIEMELESQLEE